MSFGGDAKLCWAFLHGVYAWRSKRSQAGKRKQAVMKSLTPDNKNKPSAQYTNKTLLSNYPDSERWSSRGEEIDAVLIIWCRSPEHSNTLALVRKHFSRGDEWCVYVAPQTSTSFIAGYTAVCRWIEICLRYIHVNRQTRRRSSIVTRSCCPEIHNRKSSTRTQHMLPAATICFVIRHLLWDIAACCWR